jgi:hypothetical protein
VKHAAYKFDIVKKSDLASGIIDAVALASCPPFLANELASNVTEETLHQRTWLSLVRRNLQKQQQLSNQPLESAVRGVIWLQAYRHRLCFPYQYVFISLCIV